MEQATREYLGRVAYEAHMTHIEPGRKEIFGDTWEPMESWEEQSEGIREQYRVKAEAVVMAYEQLRSEQKGQPETIQVRIVEQPARPPEMIQVRFKKTE